MAAILAFFDCRIKIPIEYFIGLGQSGWPFVSLPTSIFRNNVPKRFLEL